MARPPWPGWYRLLLRTLTLLASASVSHATATDDQPESGISLILREILTCRVHLPRWIVRPVSHHKRMRAAGWQIVRSGLSDRDCPIRQEGRGCAHEAADMGCRRPRQAPAARPGRRPRQAPAARPGRWPRPGPT